MIHNFFHYINALRIAHACKLLKDPAYDNRTLVSIAEDSGFSSKSTLMNYKNGNLSLRHLQLIMEKRGANENLNGLVRQYFPKESSFSDITQLEIKKAENILNNRPRKRHDFYSPLDIFAKKVNQINFLHL